MSDDFDEAVRRINEKKLREMKMNTTTGEKRNEAGKPLDLTDGDFRDAVRSHHIMVVDFWAPWCGPCRAVSPVLERLAGELADKATFGKLNVDDNPRTSQEFGIQGIPTILVFRDGQVVDGIVGAAPREVIEAKIRPHIGSVPSSGTPYR